MKNHVITFLALLTDGQQVPVDLSVSYREAYDAMRSLGYGRLLTKEAEAARSNPDLATKAPGSTSSAIGAQIIGVLPMAGWLLLIGAFLLWVTRRQSSSNNKSPYDPPRPTHRSTGRRRRSVRRRVRCGARRAPTRPGPLRPGRRLRRSER